MVLLARGDPYSTGAVDMPAYLFPSDKTVILESTSGGLGNAALVQHALGLPPGSPEATITLSTHLDRSGERVRRELQLRPDEGVVMRLSDSARLEGTQNDGSDAE